MKNKLNSSLSLRKVLLSALVAAPLAVLPTPLWAIPATTGNVTSNSTATTFTNPTLTSLTITDNTVQRLVLKWTEFGSAAQPINGGDLITWNLAGPSAAVLNMVTTNATTVNGSLVSNGQVFILNPNGITLGATATVNTTGLTLSTIPEAEFNFLATGSLGFSGTATQGVTVTSGANVQVGSTGNVFLAGNSANVAGTINAGNLTVNTQNGAVNLGAGGTLTLGTAGVNNADPTPDVAGWGNLTVNSTGGAVDLAAGNAVTVNGGTVTVNTGGGLVQQTGGALLSIGDTLSDGNINVNATTSGAITLSNVSAANDARLNVAFTGANTSITTTTTSRGNLRLGNSTLNGNLTIASSGTIERNGDVAVLGTRNISLNTTTGTGAADDNGFNMSRNITFTGTGDLTFTTLNIGGAGANGSITLVSRDGSVSLPAVTAGALTVTAAQNIVQTGAINNLTTGTPVFTMNTNTGAITAVASLGTGLWTVAPAVTVTDTGTGAGANITTTLNSDNSGRLANVTSGQITGGNGGTNYTAATVGGSLTGGTQVANGTSGTARFEATNGSITLTNAGNNFGTVTLRGAPAGVDLRDNLGDLRIGDATTVTGSTQLTINGGDLIFGGLGTAASTSTQSARFASSLTVPTVTNVNDVMNTITVEGSSTYTATGAVNLDGAFGNGVGLGHRFGQINVTAAPLGVRVYEVTTVNLGTVNTAGSLRVYSAAGDVIQSGTINLTGGVNTGTLVGAGTATAPGNITLDNASNILAVGTGTLTVLDDFTLLANTAAPGTGGDPIGSLLANNVTVVNNASLTLGNLVTTTNSGLAGNLNVLVTGTGNDITLGQSTVNGTVTLNAPDAITASNADNQLGVVNVTAGGIVSVRSAGQLTANATLSGTAASTFRGDTLRIGTVTSTTTGQVTFQADNDGTSALSDTVNGIRIFGNVHFNSSGSVNVSRSGHSFGRVQVSVGNNRNGVVVESGTLRLGAVQISNTGTFSATSTTGDILQDNTVAGVRLNNGTTSATNTATFSAPMGNVILEDAADNRIPRAVVTALGNVSISTSRPIGLGNVTAGGTLTVNAGTNDITQVASTRLNVFGTVSLTVADVGGGAPNSNITLTNTGNRLGGLVLTAGAGNIAVTENTTMNLKSVTTTGNFTATSEAGSVIDSTDSSVALNRVNVAGTSSFSAPAGNVTLGLGSSDYRTVSFSTSGNVTVLDSVGALAFGASTIGGTLDVISTPAGVTISQTGALNVTGNLTFTTNGGNIDLSNAANQLGSIRFTANQVVLAEATTLNLRAGSVATGAVQLSTGADFVTSGAGGSSFTNNLTISAPNGSIIPGAGSLLVVGNLTVFSNVLKDLSALSKSGNLTNRDPINLGSGTYVPPGP